MEEEDRTTCGYGSCRPKFLQKLHNSKFVCTIICALCFTQGLVVTGIIGVNMSTIERRFQLTSAQSAWIASAYDVTSGVSVLFVGYMGKTCHKAKWLAFSAISLAIGSALMALPHFVTGIYVPGDEDDICSAESAANDCSPSYLQYYLALFIAGQIFHGLGGSTLYVLAPVYLDDNVLVKWYPIYLGLFYAFSALGPAFGYIGGGVFLDIFVDVDTVASSSVKMTPNDPRWVGAWWIGFVFSSCFLSVLAMILFCFGYETPVAAKVRAEKQAAKTEEKQSLKNDTTEPPSDDTLDFREMPKITCSLLRNPVFMLITITTVITSLLTNGFAAYIAKYIQNQFNQTTSMAAILSGVVLIPGAAGAMFTGGLLVSKLKMGLLKILKMCWISVLISLLTTPCLFVACDRVNFSGVNVAYENSSLSISTVELSSSCNTDCNCGVQAMTPVCGADGVSYFSPCHAGCKTIIDNEGDFHYENCSCIAANLGKSQYFNSSSLTATNHICKSSCPLMPLFIVFLLICVFGLVITTTPSVTVTLRSVPESQRSYAMALQNIFSRFLGNVPGPILFGALIDQSCIIWQKKCGTTGSCWMYESLKMSYMWFILVVIFLFTGFILYFMAFLYIRKRPAKYETSAANGNAVEVPDAKQKETELLEAGQETQNGITL